MKVYKTEEIKNLALIGNAGSGKTTLAEAMMFEGGVINRRGDIDSKNTVSDYRDVEHAQLNSVYSTVLYTEWLGNKINFIDAPGADDFAEGVYSSVQVTATALMVLNAQNGVEVGTGLQWRQVRKLHQPVIFVLNHLDQENANFDKSVEEINQQLTQKAVIVQYPVNAGAGFNAVIDVLLMKMYQWGPDGGEPEILEIPDSEMDKAKDYQNTLIEAAAENDESLMEIFFEKETLTEDEMRSGIRAGLVHGDLFPIFCISAKKDMGVRRLMQFIGNVAPCPSSVKSPVDTEGNEVKCDPNGPTSIFVFKTSVEPHLGEVSFFKVLSGTVKEGQDLINVNKANKERLSQLYCVAGKNRQKVDQLVAGDIGATVKLKDTKTNHTLSEKGNDWMMPAISYPNPKHRTAIKALSETDDEKLGEVLHRMHEEDQTLLLEYSKELKQLIIHGQGEHHLNTMKWHLDTIHKIETEFITPKIPYRETITKAARADYKHKKQSGGSGQFGEVHMVIEPFEDGAPAPTMYKFDGKEYKLNVKDTQEEDMPWGGKLVIHNCIVGGVIDVRFIPAIRKGIVDKMEIGPLTGSYARDIRVSIYDGKMHQVDSNEISFKIAGAKAFSTAFKNAGPKIMEPVYNVEVLTPSDRMGDVMGDLQGRRAVIQGMSTEGTFEKLSVKVPLAEMNRYSTVLSSLTNGRATYSMSFDEYLQVPHDVQDELLKAYKEEDED